MAAHDEQPALEGAESVAVSSGGEAGELPPALILEHKYRAHWVPGLVAAAADVDSAVEAACSEVVADNWHLRVLGRPCLRHRVVRLHRLRR